jgi:hypothetical protein
MQKKQTSDEKDMVIPLIPRKPLKRLGEESLEY